MAWIFNNLCTFLDILKIKKRPAFYIYTVFHISQELERLFKIEFSQIVPSIIYLQKSGTFGDFFST